MTADTGPPSRRSLRIVFVNQVPSQPLLEVIACLAERGHDVTLFAGASAVARNIPGVRYLPMPSYRPSGLVSRGTSWLSFTLRVAWRLWMMPRTDLVVACTNPPLVPWAATLVGGLRGFRSAIRVLDVYPDVLQATSFGGRHFLSRCLAWMSRWSFSRCRAISTIGPSMARAIDTYAAGRPVAVIPEWPIDRSGDTITAHRPTGRFVVLVAGNVGSTHDISPLVDASRILADLNVEFLVSAEDVSRIRAMFHGCRNVCVVPRLNDAEYRESLLAAHAAFVSLKPGAETASFPSRVVNYLACGLPVIAVTARPSDLASVIERRDCGLVVSPEAAGEGVATAIRRLVTNPVLRETMSEAALATARADFDPKLSRHRFVDWVEEAASATTLESPISGPPVSNGAQK